MIDDASSLPTFLYKSTVEESIKKTTAYKTNGAPTAAEGKVGIVINRFNQLIFHY